MVASSLDSLRGQLRTVLKQEDDLLKDYNSMHGRLHDIDRELITETNEAARNGWDLRPSWAKYMRGKRREAAWQMMMKREKTRPLVEKRRALLAQVSAI